MKTTYFVKLGKLIPYISSTFERQHIRASMLEVEESSCSALFGSQNNMRGRLFIGLGLVLLQQLTGQPNILYYATDVFEAVGFCGSTLASLATVGLGTVKVGATIVSLCLVDRLGRRTLLMGGVILMATSLAALTVFAGYQAHVVGGLQHKETCAHTNTSSTHSSPFLDHLNSSSLTMCEDNPLPPALRYIAFAAIVTFVAAYSLSFGPISWIILSGSATQQCVLYESNFPQKSFHLDLRAVL